MTPFREIHARAADRKGGAKALDALLPAPPKPAQEVAAIPSDRWLSEMTKAVFRAGFVWKVVEAKWPDFEEVFHGFDPHRVAMMSDEDLERCVSDKRLIRHGKKLAATRHNATFVVDLAREHGSAGRFFADWPDDDFVGLLDVLKKRAQRLGGNTAQYFLRFMGVDGFVLSNDVVKALMGAGVVDKPPSSKRDLAAVQAAFNTWAAESGLPMSAISRTLAMSVD